MLRPPILIFMGLVWSLACTSPASKPEQPAFGALPAIVDGAVQAVVEIPAGTNLKLEYDSSSQSFLPDTLDGQARVVQFLPYPGNYGFIPSTMMDTARGGDGDALDILVISEAQSSGTVLQVHPIAALLLRDGGELDTKIIAVPKDTALKTLPAENFMDLLTEYDAARRIIEEWFEHYKGFQKVELIGWEDETYAWREVEKWALPRSSVNGQ